MKKLGIIVPYRDRYQQLITFKSYIKEYLSNKDINYELIIVEQDDAKAFNRGKLLNIGFIYAKKLKCDYVVFHDIDMMPLQVDYSYSDKPIHLATNLITESQEEKEIFDEYFGGVTMFPVEAFERINGYSNIYWGWGYEDTDLLYRCKLSKLPLDVKEIHMNGSMTAALKFNGESSYVKCENTLNFRKKTTILISFYPDNLQPNHTKNEDIFAAFGIPGFDCIISYNSYHRYTFQIFSNDENLLHISSDISINKKTIIIVVFDTDEKMIKMYQDGNLIGSVTYQRLYYYFKKKNFYLGCANPNSKTDEKFFKGSINTFAVWDDILTEAEIKELSNNKHFGYTQNFGEYESDFKLKIYYDAKFIKQYKLIDLSGNGNDGEIFNCDIVPYSIDETKLVEIPFRRKSIFGVLNHDENGYSNGGWKSQLTRYNQLRFYNEVEKGSIDTRKDGLSNCQFVKHGYVSRENVTEITVGI